MTCNVHALAVDTGRAYDAHVQWFRFAAGTNHPDAARIVAANVVASPAKGVAVASVDADRDGVPYRFTPKRGEANPARYEATVTVVDNGKVYSVTVYDHGTLEAGFVYGNGRRLPDGHKRNVQVAACEAYRAAFHGTAETGAFHAAKRFARFRSRKPLSDYTLGNLAADHGTVYAAAYLTEWDRLAADYDAAEAKRYGGYARDALAVDTGEDHNAHVQAGVANYAAFWDAEARAEFWGRDSVDTGEDHNAHCDTRELRHSIGADCERFRAVDKPRRPIRLAGFGMLALALATLAAPAHAGEMLPRPASHAELHMASREMPASAATVRARVGRFLRGMHYEGHNEWNCSPRLCDALLAANHLTWAQVRAVWTGRAVPVPPRRGVQMAVRFTAPLPPSHSDVVATRDAASLAP